MSTTVPAGVANEIKNAIIDQMLLEKYENTEQSRQKAVTKYYNKLWKPDKATMTEEELAEFEARRKARNAKARERYYAKQKDSLII